MDIQKFKDASLKHREEFIPIPEIKEFFGDGEEPGFLVRGLSGIELFKCQEEVEKAKNIEEVVAKLTSGRGVAKAVVDLLDGDMPSEYVRRLRMFVYGCVKPTIDLEFAKKFAKNYSIDFSHITNVIGRLSGEGSLKGE